MKRLSLPMTTIAGALVLAFLAGTAIAARLWPGGIASETEQFLEVLKGLGGVGWIIFASAQMLVAISGILPASLLGVAAGAIYGLPLGFALAAISTLAGAALAFLLSRSLLRPFIASQLRRRPRLRNLDTLVARDGWKFVCLLRVSPVMPFAATSYSLGFTSISLRDYLIDTLASLPALGGYVFIGTLAGAGLSAWTSGAGLVRLALLGIGLAATAVVTLRLGHLALRAGLLPPPSGLVPATWREPAASPAPGTCRPPLPPIRRSNEG